MNPINNKPLLIIIGVLLATNIFLMVAYFNHDGSGRKSGRGHSPVDFMTRELALNPEQAGSFSRLWEETNVKNKPLNDSIRLVRDLLYQNLNKISLPDSVITTLAGRIGNLEKQLAQNNYYHFKSLSTICNVEQQVKLDTLLKRMGNRKVNRKN